MENSTTRNIKSEETSRIEKKSNKSIIRKKMVCPKCNNPSLITFNDYKIKLNCCGEFTLEEYHQ
jgi:ribosomal protein S27AE